LQVEHNVSQFFSPDFPAAACVMADIKVLAKNTAQIASGKKDGPGTLPAHQGCFLSKMQMGRGHNCMAAGPAKAGLIFQSVDSTLPGT
jgi:hypothetical protein